MQNGELKGQIGFADLIYIKFALRICTDNSPFSILHSQLFTDRGRCA